MGLFLKVISWFTLNNQQCVIWNGLYSKTSRSELKNNLASHNHRRIHRGYSHEVSSVFVQEVCELILCPLLVPWQEKPWLAV